MRRRMELKACALHVALLAFAMSGSSTVQGFLQLPSSTLSRRVSYARDNFGIPTRGAGRSGAALWRMTRNDENDDGGNCDRFRPILSPVVAAVFGATLLSGDPTVTLAVQGTRTGMTPAPPAIVLAARSTTAGTDLKDMLGEYKQKVEKADTSKTVLGPSVSTSPAPTSTVEAPAPAPVPSPTPAPVPAQAPPTPPAVEPAPVTKPVPAPAPVPPPPTPPKAVTPAPPPPKPKPAAPKPVVKKNPKASDAAAKQAKAKADREKAAKEREAKAQLQAKEREIQAERQAIVDRIQKARQNFGTVPASPKLFDARRTDVASKMSPEDLLQIRITSIEKSRTLVPSVDDSAVRAVREKKAEALSTVREQSITVSDSEASLRSAKYRLEEADRQIVKDLTKLKNARTRRSRGILEDDVAKQKEIASSAKAVIKTETATLSQAKKDVSTASRDVNLLAKQQGKEEALIRVRKEKLSKDQVTARTKQAEAEKKARAAALKEQQARLDKVAGNRAKAQKDAAAARQKAFKDKQAQLRKANKDKEDAERQEQKDKEKARVQAQKDKEKARVQAKKDKEKAERQVKKDKEAAAAKAKKEKEASAAKAKKEKEDAKKKADDELRKRIEETRKNL